MGRKGRLLVEVSCSGISLAAPELLALHLELFLISKAYLNSSGGEAVSVNGGMCFYEALSGSCFPPYAVDRPQQDQRVSSYRA